MKDKHYKRTSGYRNWMNQRAYLPSVESGTARLATGRVYQVVKRLERVALDPKAGRKLVHQFVRLDKPTVRTKADYKAAAIAGQAKNQQKAA